MAAFLDRIKTRASDSLEEFPDVTRYLIKERLIPAPFLETYKVGFTDALTVRAEDTPEYLEMKKETYDFRGLQGRILFPVTSCIGGTMGFSTRRIKEEVNAEGVKLQRYKTFLSSEAKSVGAFFGIEQALASMIKTGFVYVTEGAVDCMSLATVFPNTISSLTSMLTEPQMWTLSMLVDKVVLVFDSDAPGRYGASVVIEKYGSKLVKNMDLGYHDANTALTTLGYSGFKSYVNTKLRFINFSLR